MARAMWRALREADWLDGERARVYGGLIALGLAAMTLWLLTWPSGGGLPGGDFASFYAASMLAQAGDPAAAWDPALHAAAQQAAFGAREGYLAFLYPPPFLLVCWPLALLPFGVAFWTWNLVTLAAALLALAACLGGRGPWYLPGLLLVLPATAINVLAGQNGALSLAILAGGFALLDRRPVMGGLLLGLMVIKPQLAVMLPFVLGASGRWRALVAAGIGAAAALAAGWLLVGEAGYAAFLGNFGNARAALEGGAVNPRLLQSVFAMLQPLSPLFAMVGQTAVSLAVVAGAGLVAWRSRPGGPALGALAVAATLAATPFLLDYDLTLAALPIAWLVARGAAEGFRPWEKAGLLFCGGWPLLSRAVALELGLQPMPLLSLLLLLLVMRRLRAA